MIYFTNMKKIIKLSESELKKIIKKVLMEQRISNPNIQYSDTPSSMTAGLISSKNKNENLNLISKYSCVPTIFRYPVYLLLKKGYNTLFLKTALGVIGRESTFGSGNRFDYLNPLKTLWAFVGGSTSVGYGQVKPETASQFGMDVSDLNTASGALEGVYKILKDNYDKAVLKGYSSSPSNLKSGTGNAALDMSIVAFNAGPDKIVEYCETSNSNIKRNCGLANTKETLDDGTEITITNKKVKDYVPNFKTERWDGVNISSHGYIKEVANNIKKYTCF